MKFAFESSMNGMPWGGSEELWWECASRLADEGHRIAVNCQGWPTVAPKLRELASRGARLWLRRRRSPSPSIVTPLDWWRAVRPSPADGDRWLDRERPDLVHVSLAIHVDPIRCAAGCRRRGIPYAVLVHCATTHHQLHPSLLDVTRENYASAERVWVVSEENLLKIETLLGMRLSNVELVHNPSNVSRQTVPTWPTTDEFSLACVGRIHFASKGQDLLVEVLKRPRWRARPLSVVLYGQDQGSRRQLEGLIAAEGLEETIRFGGYVDDLAAMWSRHHGLLLPSRFEGAPISVVEAMMAHRLVISTDVGRNRQLVDEGKAGFIAAAPTAELLDDALERAWAQRDRWRDIGLQAGRDIRERSPADPIGEHVARLRRLAGLAPDSGTPDSPSPKTAAANRLAAIPAADTKEPT